MDNMLDISREAFPNPALTRLSSVLHESEAATQRGIDRAFPASLTGLAEHAKRGQNAEDMLEDFQSGDYPHLTPAEVAPLIRDPVQTARIAASGEGFLARIFGPNLDQVVDMVAHQAGVSRTSAHVILGLSAPLLLDALGKESQLRHLDAQGLSRFLSDQEEVAHSMQPSTVDGAISATMPAPPITAGRDVAAAPFFGGGPAGEAPLSSAAYVSSGIPLSQIHGQRVLQAPTLDESVEERFGPPDRLTRGLLWLLGALVLISLMSWGLMRLAPRPQTPEAPPLPHNVGTSEPVQGRGASTSLPGGVTGVAATPSEPATEAAISASKPDVMPPPVNATTTPELPATAPTTPNVTGGVTEPSGAARVTNPPPALAGEAAVRALARNRPEGPRADAVRTVKPPPSETDVGNLGALTAEPVPYVSTSAGTTDGIVERQRTNVPAAATGAALPAFFAGGALPPRRFILREVEFAEGSSELPEHSRVLDKAARTLREQPGARVMIQGYAGPASNAERSELLSKKRAEAVKRYLVDHGVPANRLTTAGMADTRPTRGVSDRRVELVVLTR